MSEEAPQFAIRTNAEITRKEIDSIFFVLYSEVTALSKSARKTGQAIRFFHESRARLEHDLRVTDKGKSADDSKLDGLAARHSLLALIYWLYPTYIGYNRLTNAKLMYQHASAAVSASRSKTSIPFAIGLMVQLRITPFLIKSKKATPGQIAKIRETAAKFITKNFENPNISGALGMVNDGVGFSYFLLERDMSTALSHMTKATNCLVQQEKTILKEIASKNPSTSARTRLNFFRAFTSVAYWDYGLCNESQSERMKGEDTELSMETRSHYQRSYEFAKRTPWHIYKAMSAYSLSGTFAKEATNQLEKKSAIEGLKKAVVLGEESLKWFGLWSTYEGDFLGGSWIATFYQQLANYSDASKRKRLMARSLSLAQKAEQLVSNRKVGLARYKLVNIGDIFYTNSEYYRQLAIQTKDQTRGQENNVVELLNKSLENCLKSRAYYRVDAYSSRMVDSSLLAGDICYELMASEIGEIEKMRNSRVAKRYFNQVIKTSKRLGWNEKLAESSWRMAQVFDKEGKFSESAFYYLQAHEAYENVRESTGNSPTYSEPSNYMLAWTNIERAKLAHRSAEFDRASQLYREAASLISSTRRWQLRSQLYIAESLIEKSEEESLSENTQRAIDNFVEAVQALAKLQSELGSDDSEDSRSFLRLADQKSSFCIARIILEKSKEAYRIGNPEQSIKGLQLAFNAFAELAENSAASDSLGSNELESLASLCKALTSLQMAQISGDSKLYLTAKEIFGKASEESKSKTLKPLLSGLASFAAFLYYSKLVEEKLETGLDIEKILECNRALDSAEVVFKKLGNKSFLNMLKASKHILDATMKMNAAEREMENASVKAKLYREAQRSLTRASRYYELLGSSKRVKESLRMIGAVRNHQKLIPLAHDIIAEIASNQIIYTAISSANLFDQSPENSARELASAFLVLDLNIPKPYITLDERLPLELSLSNIGKEGAITIRIDEVLPEGFEVIEGSSALSNDRSLSISLRIEPGFSRKIELIAKPLTTGEFVWHPALVYLDGSRNYKITRAQTAKVVVESSKLIDVASMLSEKEKLEEEIQQIKLSDVDDQARTERIYSIKEKISRIEEDLFRLKNEYEKMNLQLEQTRADLSVLGSMQGGNLRTEDMIRLESEERLLNERIERRRLILEQAHLL
ncbi:MAG: hypothetical protein ABSE82_03860 [Nitrososphaerales archaeon]